MGKKKNCCRCNDSIVSGKAEILATRKTQVTKTKTHIEKYEVTICNKCFDEFLDFMKIPKIDFSKYTDIS